VHTIELQHTFAENFRVALAYNHQKDASNRQTTPNGAILVPAGNARAVFIDVNPRLPNPSGTGTIANPRFEQYFVGYIPVPAEERAARIRGLEATSRRDAQTQVLIETPYRNGALLEALLAHLQPTTRLSVSVGLTLPGGFSRSDSVAGWRQRPSTLPADLPAVFALLAGR
jgi:16S rRNA (cytidine1402-2'-O)-methyltransferase